jgi:hypothetical protein
MQVIEHLKLRKRRRLKTEEDCDAFFTKKDVVGGFEYSYAEKCTIVREQVQQRKKLDGITKNGDVAIYAPFCLVLKWPKKNDVEAQRSEGMEITTNTSIYMFSAKFQLSLLTLLDY